jgi:hypothetical protein
LHYRAAALLSASPQLAESIHAAKGFRVVPQAELADPFIISARGRLPPPDQHGLTIGRSGTPVSAADVLILENLQISMWLSIGADCQTLAYEIDMSSQHVQHACVSSWQLQMVRMLVELIKFRNHGVGVMSLALSFHLTLDRSHFVV